MLNETDLRIQAMHFALTCDNERNGKPSEIVARAEEYLAFLRGKAPPERNTMFHKRLTQR